MPGLQSAGQISILLIRAHFVCPMELRIMLCMFLFVLKRRNGAHLAVVTQHKHHALKLSTAHNLSVLSLTRSSEYGLALLETTSFQLIPSLNLAC